ncbi:MAG: c-type cytochrome biogenesis protein CcsB [Oligoflexia bacterium]|nr:c-type cytochrome biogenesis protein CcsB [Oligoflexia bacterium]
MISISSQTFTFAFICYLFSFIFYIAILISNQSQSQSKINSFATFAVILGFAAHSLGLILRWIQGGIEHPPLANMYESLLMFVWGFVAIHLYLIKQFKIHLVGIFLMMIVLVGMGLAALNPNKEVLPLVPALQSYWLHFHVFIAAISYAFFLISAIFALLYIIKAQQKLQIMNLLFDGFALFCFSIATFSSSYLLQPFHLAKVELIDNKLIHKDELISIPGIHYGFFLLMLIFVIAIIFQLLPLLYQRQHKSKTGEYLSLLSFALYFILIIYFLYALQTIDGLSLFSNPYRLGLLILGLMVSSLHRLLTIRYQKFLDILPREDVLDQLSYKSILISLPLLTLVIVTGSVWAHYAWGRYWGWDPKETWSLITWLIYALYLHLRIHRGRKGVDIAFISLIGFLSVVFTYLGVNILLSGLHSYG